MPFPLIVLAVAIADGERIGLVLVRCRRPYSGRRARFNVIQSNRLDHFSRSGGTQPPPGVSAQTNLVRGWTSAMAVCSRFRPGLTARFQ